MNSLSFEDAKALLMRVSAYDGRVFDAVAMKSWQDLLRDYSLDECVWAFREFCLSRPDDWVRPGHLAKIVNEKREEWRMMNPDGVRRRDDWLDFERQVEQVAEAIRTEREANPDRRYAVEAMDTEELGNE